MRLETLLQRRLGVRLGAGAGIHQRLPDPADHLGSDVEPGVEEHCGEHRLAGIGKDRALAPPAGLRLRCAEPQRLIDAKRQRPVRACLAPYHGVEAPREIALVVMRVAAVKCSGDREAEHPVTEELEPLIALAAPAVVQARVGKGPLEQGAVREGVAERRLERVERVLRVAAHQRVSRMRPQRTAHGQFQICQIGVSSRIEKKITSARPTKFTNGTVPT